MKKSINFFAMISCFVLSMTLAHADGEKRDFLSQKGSKTSSQGAVFENVDTNGDGSISKAEFDAYFAKQPTRCLRDRDADKEGRITPDELQSAPKGGRKQNHATTFLEQRFNAIDTNHDGVLDKQEANAVPTLKANFDQVDANKDGKVTRQEYLDAMPLLHRAIGIDSTGKGLVL